MQIFLDIFSIERVDRLSCGYCLIEAAVIWRLTNQTSNWHLMCEFNCILFGVSRTFLSTRPQSGHQSLREEWIQTSFCCVFTNLLQWCWPHCSVLLLQIHTSRLQSLFHIDHLGCMLIHLLELNRKDRVDLFVLMCFFWLSTRETSFLHSSELQTHSGRTGMCWERVSDKLQRGTKTPSIRKSSLKSANH